MSTSIDEKRRTLTSVGELPRLTATPGIVRVLTSRRRCRRHPLCTCGWTGRPRLLRCLSIHDALIHAARAGCRPAVPLVDVDIGRRP